MSNTGVRKFVRKHIEFPVRILLPSANHVVACHAKNFGAGGLGIECPVQLEPGTRVEVEFVLPGEKRVLRLTANVRSAQPLPLNEKRWRVGIQFVNVPQADQVYFTNYMAGTFLLY
ncbi:MAG: hypothetical protein A2X94_10895 [Bdellovibrionales bacterium GWB1_55_8]|nr:MAG: hypothetical protein A2X94_10895 [Bdellovibrionales bacterium GWB1_55_8]